jgi:hypothetical protein
MSFECRPERPWGLHPTVYSDEECPRCGWVAPGPVGDARADAEALACAGEAGWPLGDGGAVPEGDGGEALAA